MTAKNRNKNQKVTNWGSRQGRAQWQTDQGSQKGSLPGKPNSLRTNMSKKLPEQYQGHWLDVQPVPKYFQIRDSQAILQGIMISHGEHAKLRCSQLHTQAKNYQLLGR